MKSKLLQPPGAQALHNLDGDEAVKIASSASSSSQSASSERGSETQERSAGELSKVNRPGFAQWFVANWKFVSIVCTLLVASIVGAYFAYQHFNPKPATAATLTPPVVTVTSAIARYQSVKDTIVVTGSVHAWDPLSVGSEVSGLRIQAVNVEEGDHVKKGQILAVLNSSLLRAQLEQARARLQSSQATHRKSVQPNRPEDILALRAAVSQLQATVAQEEAHLKQAHVNLQNAELNAQRFRELAKAGAVSNHDSETRQVTADTAREEIRSAQEKVNAARFSADQAQQRLSIALQGGRKEDVAISEAAIAEIEAQIKHLQAQIQQTYITAPDDGLIAKRDAHMGDIASVGTPLFSIIRLNRLELRAQVSDLDLAKFTPGQTVLISTHETENGNIKGKVRLVNPQVDTASRLGMVRIDLPAQTHLKQGMFVRGQVEVGQREALTVPTQSVVTNHGESIVFKLDNKRAISTPVKVGVRSEKFVEIKQGLNAGDVVVAKGSRFLSDRDVVEVSQ